MPHAADPLSHARLLLERGLAAEARDVLDQAIADGLDGAPVHSLMGFILHQLGDLAGCEHELRQAVHLAPDDGAAEFALASILNRLGKETEAESSARAAIAKGMDNVHSHLLLGRILGKQDR